MLPGYFLGGSWQIVKKWVGRAARYPCFHSPGIFVEIPVMPPVYFL